ncbi:rhomboid family intramembrane serine protease [Maribacter hydrothermalis]|uniref:Rhomboid family intramembrane serine protease n=1 Tax=Maribacter hydrothermalis TaxID=1836467 RepID=A0A1B7ZC31_9FLAO|nr:rhomboid family intramembrane serine protease [Maribacter hydrothermalis]APQ17935.1 rhomboid family intramembrane serine protease [Maribacter hydrothermalis]OBR40477.1 rhomboid family intramembrane serine protease [Maribacter hydrothermalis]
MSEIGHFKFSNRVLAVPLTAMIIIWGVYWIELALEVNFNEMGVMPRTLLGLRGVVLSPFIHGSLEHLYNNTIPLAILLSALWYFYRDVAWKVVLFGILLSGLITWLIGRTSYHIGASGLIYVLASFIFFKGIFSSYFRLVALSLIVVFIYGSMLWYIFPVKEGMSWEGHLAGFLTGLFLAKMVKARIPQTKKYDWEKEDFKEEDDPFLQHFDENGNFKEISSDEDGNEDENLKFNYVFKKSPKSDLDK